MDSDTVPIFKVYDAAANHWYRIYRSGRIEGFPEGCVIVNAVLAFENEAIDDFCKVKGIER